MKTLCASTYVFCDTIGYFHSGCENHARSISAFRYNVDSTGSVRCDFIPYAMFFPYSKMTRTKIDKKDDSIRVVVHDVFGKMQWPEVAIIRVGKKKDKIIRSDFAFRDTLSFKRMEGKNIFWTVEGLYPIFFAEMHFRVEPGINFYEIWLNLPKPCFEVTEAKGWAEGVQKFKIINSKKLVTQDKTVEYITY